MYSVDITEHADEDLDNIIKYLRDELASPGAASDFVDKVYECYDRLEENPYIYSECYDGYLKSERYRRAVIKNYVLLYKVDENLKQVIVYRFFHGMQDYANLISITSLFTLV